MTPMLWTMIALTALTTTACGGYDESGDPLDDQEVAETEQAATNISDCATGETANAVENISTWGTSDSYKREGFLIDFGCPSSRDTTYVEVPVMSSQVYKYHFVVTPSGPNWSANTQAKCENLGFATRVQRQLSDGTWESLKYVESHGVWVAVAGACAKPAQFSWDRVNNHETSRYRVRTWAIGNNDLHADVTISTANFGPP
ncbi:MAG: hypothetical protein WKG00_11965 [Polyangiaceae bacterium]